MISGRHLTIIAASACAAVAVLTGAGAGAYAAPATDPYVMECLQGDYGMARWSDGTTRFSELCTEGGGGPHNFGQPGPVVPDVPDTPTDPGTPGVPDVPGEFGGPAVPQVP